MVMNSRLKEIIKTFIAACSYRSLRVSFVAYFDKKESRQLIPKKTEMIPVTSSMNVKTLNPEILNVVNTTKQNPSKFDEVPNMFEAFSVAIIYLKLLNLSFLFVLKTNS